MALTDNGKIATWVTVKQACHLLWTVRKQHIILSVIAFLPFIILIATAPHRHIPIKSYNIWLLALGILWQRLFLVGPGLFLKLAPLQFIKIALKLIAYCFILFLIFFILFMIFSVCTYGMMMLWYGGSVRGEDWLLTAVVSVPVSSIIIAIIIARLIPTFVGICVEENIPLRKSWELVRENTSFLWLMISLFLLSTILTGFATYGLLSSFIINLISQAGFNIKIYLHEWGVASLLLSPIFFAGLALQLAVQAIAYRDLVPQPKQDEVLISGTLNR